MPFVRATAPVGILACLALTVPAATAHATSDTVVPLGASVGYTQGTGGGWHLGGEVSVAHVILKKNTYYVFGGYTDLIFTSGGGQTRFSVGPEVGWFPHLMVDMGYQGISRGAGYEHGFCARIIAMLPLPSFMVYARVNGVGSREVFADVGLLMKLPIPLGPVNMR